MMVVNNRIKISDRSILAYLPSAVRNILYNIDLDGLEEIRLRRGLPIKLYFSDSAFYINNRGVLQISGENSVRAGKKDMDEAVELITGSSVYAVSDEIKNGYITLNGGHRVGICGRAVLNNGEVEFIKEISGLNYRIAHEIKGTADKVIESILGKDGLRSTLIISPPQCGKTTLLRDIAAKLSDKNIKVGIVDERGEIAGMNNGIAGYELGANVDVLDFCPKDVGMIMMLRSMSPEVIITDEIGSVKDADAVEDLINSGVRVITSIHARNLSDVMRRDNIRKICDMFECYITLSRRNGVGTIEDISVAEEIENG